MEKQIEILNVPKRVLFTGEEIPAVGLGTFRLISTVRNRYLRQYMEQLNMDIVWLTAQLYIKMKNRLEKY